MTAPAALTVLHMAVCSTHQWPTSGFADVSRLPLLPLSRVRKIERAESRARPAMPQNGVCIFPRLDTANRSFLFLAMTKIMQLWNKSRRRLVPSVWLARVWNSFGWIRPEWNIQAFKPRFKSSTQAPLLYLTTHCPVRSSTCGAVRHAWNSSL